MKRYLILSFLLLLVAFTMAAVYINSSTVPSDGDHMVWRTGVQWTNEASSGGETNWTRAGTLLRPTIVTDTVTGNSFIATNTFRNFPQPLAYAATTVWLDASVGNFFNLTATNDFTLRVTNVLAGWTGVANIRQDGTGSRLLTLNTMNIKTNALVTLSTAANALDVLYLSADDRGTNVNVFLHAAFQ